MKACLSFDKGTNSSGMGNTKSGYDDSHTDFWHQPSYEPPSYAGSSMDHNNRPRQQATFIPDNFSSLDQVFTVILTFIC